MLNKNIKYYLDNHHQLINQYSGKFIVIIDQQVIGEYNRGLEAYNELRHILTPGDYLIRLCKSRVRGDIKRNF